MVTARRAWFSTLGAVLLLPALCFATDVSVVGLTPGQSAEIVIDGGAPVTIEVGETIEGVRLLRTDADSAVLRIDGTTQTLPLVAHRPMGGDTGRGGGVSPPRKARRTPQVDHSVTMSRCMGASTASRRFCARNGTSWSSIARCSTSTSALKSARSMPSAACEVFMSCPV